MSDQNPKRVPAVGEDVSSLMDPNASTGDPVGDAASKAEHIKGPMSWTDRLLSLLPMAGGVAGDVAGARFGLPGRIVGGGLVGGAGELVRGGVNMARGVPWAPESLSDLAGDVGKQAATQAGLTVGGAALAGGARAIGRSMVENAVRPPISLQREFPDAIDTIINERIPVGRGPINRTPGSQQAATQLRGVTRQLKALLDRAEQAGVRHDPNDIAKPIQDLVRDLMKEPVYQENVAAVNGMLSKFLRDHPGPMTPAAVKELKQRAQALAASVYRAEDKGNVIPAAQGLEARFNRAIGVGAKRELETAPQVGGANQAVYDQMARDIGTTEAHSQRLIGATRAVSQAEMRRLPLWAEASTAGAGVLAGLLGQNSGISDNMRNGVLTYLVARGLASPRTLSRAGLVLTQRQLQQLYRQFPRLAEAAVSASRGEPLPPEATTEPQ